MGKIMINDINFSGGGPQIDDNSIANSTTWSSSKTNTEITKVAHNSADEYDDTRTSSNKYNQGDLCIYNNTLYKCTASGGAYGSWDSSKWSSTTIEDELSAKADASTTYTKTEVDTALSNKQDKIPNTVAKTVTFDVTPSGGEVKAKVYNRVLYVSGYFRFSANQSANTQLLHISDVMLAMEVFESCFTDGSSTVRFKLTTDGKLINENQLQANQWMSISLTGLIA